MSQAQKELLAALLEDYRRRVRYMRRGTYARAQEFNLMCYDCRGEGLADPRKVIHKPDCPTQWADLSSTLEQLLKEGESCPHS